MEDLSIEWIAFGVAVLSCQIVASLMGNISVLYLYVHFSRLRTIANSLIVSVSIADLLASLSCVFIYLVSLLVDCPLDEVVRAFNRLTTIASCLSMLLITVDRYLSVARLGDLGLLPDHTLVGVIVVWSLAGITSIPYHRFFSIDTGENYTYSVLHNVSQSDDEGPACWMITEAVFYSIFVLLPLTLMAGLSGRMALLLASSDSQIRPCSVIQAPEIRFDNEIRTANSVILLVVLESLFRSPFALQAAIRSSLPLANTAIVSHILLLIYWTNTCLKPYLYLSRNPNVLEWLCLPFRYSNKGPAPPPPPPPLSFGTVSTDDVVLQQDQQRQRQCSSVANFITAGSEEGGIIYAGIYPLSRKRDSEFSNMTVQTFTTETRRSIPDISRNTSPL